MVHSPRVPPEALRPVAAAGASARRWEPALFLPPARFPQLGRQRRRRAVPGGRKDASLENLGACGSFAAGSRTVSAGKLRSHYIHILLHTIPVLRGAGRTNPSCHRYHPIWDQRSLLEKINLARIHIVNRTHNLELSLLLQIDQDGTQFNGCWRSRRARFALLLFGQTCRLRLYPLLPSSPLPVRKAEYF